MRNLNISGAVISEHKVFQDERGMFREWYKKSDLDSHGIQFHIAQANHSHSLKSVLRGVHYSIAVEGQQKLVTCASGEILDVLVDLRLDSPTFLNVERVVLTAESGDVLFVPTGVGHSFLVTSESASVVYLTSSEFDPENEKAISPLDPFLGLGWDDSAIPEFKLSERDRNAPLFTSAREAGNLPKFSQ